MYQPKNKFKFALPKFKVGEAVTHTKLGDTTVTSVMPEAGGWWYGIDKAKYFVHESELTKKD